MYLVVSVDTEEDNWGDFDRPSYTVENINRIPGLQEIFEKRGVRPTYLVTYPVAMDAKAVKLLGGYRERGLCEIGAHLHPWNTPPVSEARSIKNSYLSSLPVALQLEKVRTLTETIGENFGVKPTSFRSGRWGFSDDIAAHLIRLGYAVDTSVKPTLDNSPSGGPDFSQRTLDPFIFNLPASSDGGGALLEVPPTVDFLQRHRAAANWMFQSAMRLPHGQRLTGVLNKAGVVNRVAISPEIAKAPDMIRMTRALLDRGTTVLNMFFHSPTLLERCSPFVRTPAHVASFLQRIDEFLAFTQSAGLQPATMSELTAPRIGASRVCELPAS